MIVGDLAALGAPQTRLGNDDVDAIFEALERDGATARFVGGCVRNALMGAGVTDLDVAVDRPPEETTRLLEAAGLKAVPTGVDHGTVTALTPQAHEPIEVTSLRRDVATDGRRAVVAFTEDWLEDARRRDFTMNALYADRRGTVFDPLGDGLADLRARKIRFIGRAADRIREDALRILRFFRFLAWYGAPERAEAADVADVREGAKLIGALARERIGQEMRKLLAADDPSAALTLMDETGALQASFAPHSAPHRDRLDRLMRLERATGAPPDALRRLAALSDAPGPALTERLRLSKNESRALDALRTAAETPPAKAGFLYGAVAAERGVLVTAARDGLDAARATEAIAAARGGAAAEFPIAATDLIALGLTPGPQIGALLKRLQSDWIDAGFELRREELLVAAAREIG